MKFNRDLTIDSMHTHLVFIVVTARFGFGRVSLSRVWQYLLLNLWKNVCMNLDWPIHWKQRIWHHDGRGILQPFFFSSTTFQVRNSNLWPLGRGDMSITTKICSLWLLQTWLHYYFLYLGRRRLLVSKQCSKRIENIVSHWLEVGKVRKSFYAMKHWT